MGPPRVITNICPRGDLAEKIIRQEKLNGL